ncbi:MAG: sulfatase, partial [Lentisphaeraceae bacterium]|nr:sulfatase [Lentisphaeraceae bacterium]
MKRLTGLIFYIFLTVLNAGQKDRPNILWITVEDMSPTLGAYGDAFAKTPFLDQFSQKCLNYSNAFATAPVCSPSRSCLINGVYAQSQGTHQMRSAYNIPDFMNGFPSLLRQAGYYTTNNVKTDYNSANFQKIISASWDESSSKADWRGRKKEQPFFSVINLMTTHQSRTMVWPYDKFQKEIQSKLAQSELSDPQQVKLPPYYPDTPVIRKAVARFYDCLTLMDKEVQEILKKLKDDGLSDDTIVFFYSDHGSGMPRHKRALLDSGMRVPLMVHFPEKYKHLAPSGQGSWTDQLVSFVDFGPTVLSLCGQEIPNHVQGQPFLGKAKTESREYVYGHRDRVDEVIDMSRSIRNKKYLYIRNFMPHISYNAPTAWPDLGEIRHEFYRMTNKETMTKAQWHYAGPEKPVEELYDCESDPQNLENLAQSAKHLAIKNELKNALLSHVLKVNDLGFLAESSEAEINKNKLSWDFARSGGYSLRDIYSAAEDVGTASEAKLIENLKSKNKHVRYWGAIGLTAFKKVLNSESISCLVGSLDDPSEAVRIQ